MKAFGIDISVWQTNDAKNPTRFFDPFIAKEKGVQFAFIRASSGLAKDNAVDHVAETFTAAGIPHGFYHYAYPQYAYDKQVDFFWNVIKDKHQDLPPVLDLEQPGIDGKYLTVSFTQKFLGALGSKCGKTPVIYTSPSFWNAMGGSNTATWALTYPLWIANYKNAFSFPQYGNPETVDNGLASPTLPNIWQANGIPWTWWQYCAAGDGEFFGGNYAYSVNKSALDMNAFNGTIVEMYKRFAIGDVTPEPPDPPFPVDTGYAETTVALRGRTAPIYIADQSALVYPQGTKLEKVKANTYYEETKKEDASGITWRRVIMYVSDKYVKDV